MKSRTRYILIALGIGAFIFLAPLIVLFVSGTKYDFNSKRFYKTGIISVKTDPKRADIYLNGVLEKRSPATMRFVTPGDYDISIRKEGYFNWDKRLNVKAQYFTSIQQELERLYLFKSQPEIQDIRQGVINFLAGDRKIIYLTNDKLFLANTDNPWDTQELSLPKQLSYADIISSKDQNYYLIYNLDYYLFFDAKNNSLLDVSNMINSDASAISSLQIEADRLYILRNGELDEINLNSKHIKKISSNVSGFKLNGQGIYITQGSNLYIVKFSDLQKNVILSDLPLWRQTEIYLNKQNRLFIIGDNSLYILNPKLEKIADYIQYFKIYDNLNRAMYATYNEVNVYDLLDNKIEFVTRSSRVIKDPEYVPDTGWVFFTSDNRLQNIELDKRDHQNNYTFASADENSKFFVDQQARYVILLRGNKLERLMIR